MDQQTTEGFAFHVRGRVQGVAFRWFGRRAAEELGILGWIRNRPDGGVEGEAFGPGPAMASFLERLREGPQRARVDQLDSRPIDAHRAPPGFEIRY